jgi:hypothetical protein
MFAWLELAQLLGYRHWHGCQCGALTCRSHNKIKFSVYMFGLESVFFFFFKKKKKLMPRKILSHASAKLLLHEYDPSVQIICPH